VEVVVGLRPELRASLACQSVRWRTSKWHITPTTIAETSQLEILERKGHLWQQHQDQWQLGNENAAFEYHLAPEQHFTYKNSLDSFLLEHDCDLLRE